MSRSASISTSRRDRPRGYQPNGSPLGNRSLTTLLSASWKCSRIQATLSLTHEVRLAPSATKQKSSVHPVAPPVRRGHWRDCSSPVHLFPSYGTRASRQI